MNEIQGSLAGYERRIADLNSIISAKDKQINEQKKTIDVVAAELRKTREDKHISSLKDKSA